MSKTLRAGGDSLRDASTWLIAHRSQAPDDALAAATPFLEAAGTVVAAAMLGRQYVSELTARTSGERWAVRRGAAAEFHLSHLVPQATTVLTTLESAATTVERFVP